MQKVYALKMITSNRNEIMICTQLNYFHSTHHQTTDEQSTTDFLCYNHSGYQSVELIPKVTKNFEYSYVVKVNVAVSFQILSLKLSEERTENVNIVQTTVLPLS